MSIQGTSDGWPVTTSAEAHAIGADAAADLAATLKAIADPLRLRMLSAIATSPTGETTAGDLATLTAVSQPTVSHHLKVLRDVGLLTADRRGTWVWYRIAPGYRGAVTTLLDRFAPAAVEVHGALAGRGGAGHAGTGHGEIAGLGNVDPTLDRLAASLAERFPGTPQRECYRVVRESYAALARRGGNAADLVPLTEHFARQRIIDAEKARAADAEHKPQVLFVCVANAGRSQLAAALLQHYAGDRVVVRSAGSAPASDVHAAVRGILDELGDTAAADVVDDVARFYPKPLTDDAVRAADVVVTMGCGDACPVLPDTRYEDWTVGDPALASPVGVAAIRDELDRRVRVLLASLLPTDDMLPAGGTPSTGNRNHQQNLRRNHLESRMPETSTPNAAKPSALFVCVHNAGRSQMAAGFLRALSDGAVEVRSAGSMPADQINPMAVEAMLEVGIDIRTEKPKILTNDAVMASDAVITMGCGDACPYYPGKNYQDWELDDPAGQGLDAVRPIRDEIERRVRGLLTELGVPAVA